MTILIDATTGVPLLVNGALTTMASAPPPNTAPVAVDDPFAVNADATLSAGNVLTNDTDAELDTLTLLSFNGGGLAGTQQTLTGGELANLQSDGSIFFDPNGVHDALLVGQSAQVQFDYVVDDGNGGQDTGLITITINGVFVPATVKQSHIAMITSTGRKSGASLVDVDVNNLPSGMSYNGTFNFVSVSSGTHTDLRFLNVDVVGPAGANAKLENCIVERTLDAIRPDGQSSHQLDIYDGAAFDLQSVEIIDMMDVEGSSSAIRQRNPSSGSATACTWNDVLCRGQGNDGIKPAGNNTINQVVIAGGSNVPASAFVDQGGGNYAIPSWSAGLFMPAGSYVRRGVNPGFFHTFLVLSDNTGGALPPFSAGVTGSNALFQGKDPHQDRVNWGTCMGDSTGTDIIVVRDAQSALLPAAWRGWNIKDVNSFRLIQNASLTLPYSKVTLTRCSSIGQSLDTANAPIGVGQLNASSYAPPEFIDCYIDSDLGGQYIEGQSGSNHIWTSVFDWTSEASIPQQ